MFPFSVRADVSAGCTLRHGETTIAGIAVEASLTGPKPYHIWGQGSVSVLCVTITVPFDETFGERVQSEIPAKDPWEDLRKVLEDPNSWSGKLGEGVIAAVNLFAPSDTATPPPPLVHPSGAVEFRQRVVPLNKRLERFGDYSLEGSTRYDIKQVGFGAGSGSAGRISWKTARDYLPPALSENLTDDQKLSRPSFEMETVGIEAIPQSMACGRHRRLDVEYETRLIDSEWESRSQGKYVLPHKDQLAQTLVSAKSLSTLAHSGARKFAQARGLGKGAVLDDEQYVIVSTENLAEQERFGIFFSQGEADRALRSYLAEAPADREKFQVMPMTQSRFAA
jgi:hypothetical protein